LCNKQSKTESYSRNSAEIAGRAFFTGFTGCDEFSGITGRAELTERRARFQLYYDCNFSVLRIAQF
jgi:hypothetical protein